MPALPQVRRTSGIVLNPLYKPVDKSAASSQGSAMVC
jgi:hypothetical protein